MVRNPDQRIVVVGAGVVGLACAYSLARRQIEPLVIDAAQPGTGASWGNAGHIVFAPEIVAPLPAPGVVWRSLRWLSRRDSPLRLTPRLELDYLRWLMMFISNCSPRAAEAGLNAMLRLNAGTGELFDGLLSAGLEFDMERRGLLVVYKTPKTFRSALEKLRSVETAPPSAQILSRDEAMRAEPLLSFDSCCGAIRYEAERQIRPDKLVQALVAELTRLGVEIRPESPCLEIRCDAKTVTGVRTPDETLRGRGYVLAAGTQVARLARQAGLRIPLAAGRGYSFDISRDELPLRAPMYLYEGRLALTPFADFTRVVGMMELGANGLSIRPRAIETMNRVGAASFDMWPPNDGRAVWAGLRPMTPDGLPIIGGVQGIPNLFVAAGHGMLGVTLSLRTGEAIAECVQHGHTDRSLDPFSPDRFAQNRPWRPQQTESP